MATDAMIPHQGTMRLVDSINDLDHGQKKGRVSSTLTQGKPIWSELANDVG